MKKYIFRVGVEVTQMEGTQLPSECGGACVNVYLGADDIRDAIDLAECELLSDCYKPIYTYEAYELDLEDTDYNTDEEGEPGNDDLLNLQKNGGIWYGCFHTYPPESEQLQ
jgi:hypothetical protein